jgi:hypothetical protein
MIDLTPATKGEPEAAPVAQPLAARAGGWFGVLTALLLYLVTRLVQLAMIDWMTPSGGPSVRDHLLGWDAGWFVRVATEGYAHGYSYDDHGQMVGNGLAFFPLYPLMIRAAAATGLSPQTAALLVSWLAGAAAAVLLHLLGTSLYSRRVGFALVVLACAQPMSVVLSMGYSEGPFLALVAGMLLAAHRRAWPAAGVLGLAAALTRPTGAAAAVALAVAALGTLRGSSKAASPLSPTQAGMPRICGRTERWQALTASAVALAGVPAYLLWVALRVGDWNAWFTIQTAGWGSSFDYGSSVIKFAVDSLHGGTDWVPLSTVWILAVAVVAAVVAVGQRVWVPLTVYGLLALVLVLGQAGYYHSKQRLLVPVLLILVPAAVALGRARLRTAVPVLAGYAAFGLWYGAHMVAVWPYTI